eukprot:6195348-Pleurochrysis_carterae.AAC.1
MAAAAGAAATAGAAREGDGADGGRVADRPRLSAYVRDQLDRARLAPLALFASRRNLAPVTAEELVREPMPEGLIETQPAELPRARRRGRARRALQRGGGTDYTPLTSVGGERERPPGPVAITELFDPAQSLRREGAGMVPGGGRGGGRAARAGGRRGRTRPEGAHGGDYPGGDARMGAGRGLGRANSGAGSHQTQRIGCRPRARKVSAWKRRSCCL